MAELTDKRSWNLSQYWIQNINGSLLKAHKFWANDRPDLSFTFFREAKLKVIPNLKEDQREKLKKKEIEIKKIIAEYTSKKAQLGSFPDPKTELELIGKPLEEAKQALEEYNEILLDLMDEYELLLSRKEDKTSIN